MYENEKSGELAARLENALTNDERKYLKDFKLWENLSAPKATQLLNRFVEGVFSQPMWVVSPNDYFNVTENLLLTRPDAYEVCISSARRMRDALLKTTKEETLSVAYAEDVRRLANALVTFKDATPAEKSNPAWRASVVETMLTQEIESSTGAIQRQKEILKDLKAKKVEIHKIATGQTVSLPEKTVEPYSF